MTLNQHEKGALQSTSQMVRRIVNHEVKNTLLSIDLEASELFHGGKDRTAHRSDMHHLFLSLSSLREAIDSFNQRLTTEFHDDQNVSIIKELDRDEIPLKAERLRSAATRLSDRWKGARDSKSNLRNIRRTAYRVSSMVDALVKVFSHDIDPLQLSPMQINTVLEDVISALPVNRRSQVYIQADAVPAIFANPTLVFIAISNLVLNGLQHTQQGVEPKVEIEVQLTQLEALIADYPITDALPDVGQLPLDWLIVFVKDNGLGVPENRKASVFRPLVRLDASGRRIHLEDGPSVDDNTEARGKGIGLTLVKLAAEKHSGVVSLNARGGGGTVALFAIPANGPLHAQRARQ